MDTVATVLERSCKLAATVSSLYQYFTVPVHDNVDQLPDGKLPVRPKWLTELN
jgi:hypothetical protein